MEMFYECDLFRAWPGELVLRCGTLDPESLPKVWRHLVSSSGQLCFYCNGKPSGGPYRTLKDRKIILCSKSCWIKAGLGPRPQPKARLRVDSRPRAPGTPRAGRRYEEGLSGAI